jgi:hypothetical protein
MKTSAIIAAILIPLGYVQGQGDINFANIGSGGVDAPVSNAAGNRIIGPGPYVADLFWSSDTSTPMDSLMPAGFNQPFSTVTLNGGGYFVGGPRTMPVATLIAAQVRVWDTTFGATYAQARDNGGEFGFSNVIFISPSIPPGPPTPLFGLQGFQLERIPEPSVSALMMVGGAFLLFRKISERS